MFRTVMPMAAANFDFVRSTGLTETLAQRGQLIAEEQVSAPGDAGKDAVYVLEHPRLPYVSYPYEWSFGGLKAAALLHLDVHLAALERGVTLSDASAYNVQFIGSRPIFIDALSFVPYEDGSYWAGHQQFCNQFLNPLLLTSRLGIPHHAWYRGALEGIDTEELNRLLPWRSKLSWNVFTHVVLQARFSRQGARKRWCAKTRGVARLAADGVQGNLAGLAPLGSRNSNRWVAAPTGASTRTTTATARMRQRQRVAASPSSSPKRNLVSCSTSAAIRGTTQTWRCKPVPVAAVGFDFDPAAVHTAFQRAAAEQLELLPLVAGCYESVARTGVGNRLNVKGS